MKDKTQWIIYTRGTIELNRMAIMFTSIYKHARTFFDNSFCSVLYYNEDPKLWCAWGTEIKDIGKQIVRDCTNKTKALTLFAQFDDCTKRALAAARKIKKQNLSNCTNQELIYYYDYLSKESSSAHALLTLAIDAFDVVFDNYLKIIIKEELANKKSDLDNEEFMNLYQEITTPQYRSYINLEKEAIMTVAQKKKTDLLDVQNIHKKFWWTKLGWENMTPHTIAYFSNQVKKNKNSTKKELLALQEKTKEIKQRRDTLCRDYFLSDKIKHTLWIMDKFCHYLDLRKEMQVKTVYAAHLLGKEVSKRYKMNTDDFEWLWYDEIKQILRGGTANKKEIEKRKKATFVLLQKNSIKTLSGREAQTAAQQELDVECSHELLLTGIAASKGQARARVKVCCGAKDALKKVKKGDILVCGMTLPDYVPAMEKAAAIITDEGGLTCHAAIISRELEIPCVVGTKKATYVLSDGDLVKVNATKGEVKILKEYQ